MLREDALADEGMYLALKKTRPIPQYTPYPHSNFETTSRRIVICMRERTRNVAPSAGPQGSKVPRQVQRKGKASGDTAPLERNIRISLINTPTKFKGEMNSEDLTF